MAALVARVRRVRDALVLALEWLLITAFVALTLDVLWGVFSRYVLGAQSRWTEELAIYLLVWVSLIGAAVTYAEKGHLGVDYFVGKMHPDAQRIAAICVELTVMFFSGFVLLYGGGVLITKTFEAGQVSPAMGVKMGYLYFSAPISGFFFTLFSLERLIELFTGSGEDAGDAAASPVESRALE